MDSKNNGKFANAVIRIGKAYQATVPPLEPLPPVDTIETREIAIWKPNYDVKEDLMQGYINLIVDKCGFGIFQAIGILYAENFDFIKALSRFKTLGHANSWPTEDIALFENSVIFYGKEFKMMRNLLSTSYPLTSIVEHYYRSKYMDFTLLDEYKIKKKNKKDVQEGDRQNRHYNFRRYRKKNRAEKSEEDATPVDETSNVELEDLLKEDTLKFCQDKGNLKLLKSEIEVLKRRVQTNKQIIELNKKSLNIEIDESRTRRTFVKETIYKVHKKEKERRGRSQRSNAHYDESEFDESYTEEASSSDSSYS